MKSDVRPKVVAPRIQGVRQVTAAELFADALGESDLAFQHSILCQTSLPYRRLRGEQYWERINGGVAIAVTAASFLNAKGERVREVPWGTLPRLMLAHFSTEAVRTGSPVVQLHDSVCTFLREFGFDTNGRMIARFKDAATSLAACQMQISWESPTADGRGQYQHRRKFDVVDEMDLWRHEAEGTHQFWPSTVTLGQRYFEQLSSHAVPLDRRALLLLRNNSMALDTYCWLAQRLHRIPEGRPVRLNWEVVKAQFGVSPERRTRSFREDFKRVLGEVLAVYGAAKVSVTTQYLELRHSRPSVDRTLISAARSKRAPSREPAAPKPAVRSDPKTHNFPLSQECWDEVRALCPGADPATLYEDWHRWSKAQKAETKAAPEALFLGWVKKIRAGKPVGQGLEFAWNPYLG